MTERSIVEDNSGWYAALIESNAPGTAADAIAIGRAYLDKFARVPYAVEYITTYGGIRAGMHQRIALTKFGPAFDATFIVESSTLVQENGIWYWRVRAINGALANNWLTKLRKIATGKGSALSGGNSGMVSPTPTGGGGEPTGPAPAASNVSAASVTASYGMWANASAFGLSGSFTLPTTNPNYHAPQFVRVVVTLPDGSTDEVCPPVPAGTTVFHGPIQYFQDGAEHSLAVKFLCVNEDGAVSASPFSVNVTVNPSAVTQVVGREVPNSLTVDSVTRLVSTTIGATPTLSGGQLPQNTSYLLSEDGGATFVWIGWETIKAAGQEVLFKRVKPSTAQTWKVAMVAGAVGGDPSKRIPAASLPAGAVVSAGFPVGALAVPAPNLITSLTVSAGAGGSYPYNQTTADGTQYFSIAQFSYDDSACVNDPNAFVVNTTVQDLDSNRSPIGPEQLFATTLVKGQVQTLGPLAGAYGTDGFSYVRSSPYPGGAPTNVAYVRVKQYVSNRADQTPTAFSNPLASTLQVGIGGGVGYTDVTVASGGGIPAGRVAASRLMGTVPGNTLPLGSDGTLSLDGSGNVIVNQPALVIGNLSGSLNVSRVSDLSTIAVASLSGSLDVSRVTNLGTLTIESFSGSLSVSRVASLNTISVSSFSGNLDVARVTNLYTLFIWGFSGNLDVSRVTNLGTLYIANFSGNLDVSRVTNLTTISLSSFSGNLDVSRITNIGTLSIASFSGNIDISRVNNITSINIGTLSGTLNVTYQVANGSIPISKLATLYVNNIQGWDGAQINCPSGILFTNGSGGILSIGGGSLSGTGTANMTGYWVQHYGSPILAIDNFANGAFNNLQVNGSTTYGGESGQTTTAIAIQKPDGSTGYLRFRNGALVAITNF